MECGGGEGGGRCCSRVGTTRGGSGWPRRRRRRRRLSWTKSILWPPIPRHPFASSLTFRPLPTNPPPPPPPSPSPSDSIHPSKAVGQVGGGGGGGGRRVVWAGCRCRVITTLKTRVALAHPTPPAPFPRRSALSDRHIGVSAMPRLLMIVDSLLSLSMEDTQKSLY